MKRLLLAVALVAALIPATASAAPTDCNAIVSMSQGKQVYYGVQFGNLALPSPLEAATGEEWMLLLKVGKPLNWFTNPANWNTLQEEDRCGTDAEIDQIVFIFDPTGSGSLGPPVDNGATMVAHLNQVLAIAASRYPNAEVALTLLVGADSHVYCWVGPQYVKASRAHSLRIGQMTMPEAGPDLDIPCSGYVDPTGHLSDAGASNANADLAAWFNAGQEPQIPATIPHPNIVEANGYTIGVHVDNLQHPLWRAPYLYDVPYADQAGWIAGDRIGYSCAYGFLEYQGEIVGRFTFRDLAASFSYIVINDKFMVEGGRFYNGTPTPPGTQQVPQSECPPRPTEYASSTVSQLPRIVFWSGNQPLEIRDYRGVNAGPGVTFELLPTQAGGRIPVLARENGVPAVVVYYDPLGSGRVTADLPG